MVNIDGIDTNIDETIIATTLKSQLLQGYLSANLLALVYRYTINSKATVTAIGRDLTKYLPIKKRTSKGIRYIIEKEK